MCAANWPSKEFRNVKSLEMKLSSSEGLGSQRLWKTIVQQRLPQCSPSKTETGDSQKFMFLPLILAERLRAVVCVTYPHIITESLG